MFTFPSLVYEAKKPTMTTIDNVQYLNLKKFKLFINGHDDIKYENI